MAVTGVKFSEMAHGAEEAPCIVYHAEVSGGGVAVWGEDMDVEAEAEGEAKGVCLFWLWLWLWPTLMSIPSFDMTTIIDDEIARCRIWSDTN